MFWGRRPADGAADAELAALREELEVLRRRTGVMESAVDVLPVGFVVRHRDGTQVRNGAARAMAGARTADVLADQVVEEVLVEAESGGAVTRHLELHGPPRRVLVISARALHDGGAVAVVEDVTERHQLDAVRRDFVANVSHELRTPLGALSVLADTIADNDDPEVIRRLAGRMATEVSRAARLVDELLDLSRIEATGVRDPDELDLVEAVTAAVEGVGADSVQLTAVDQPVPVVGDRQQLVSAVANLVDNAVKYSEPGDAVTVSVAADGADAVVTVRDCGIGIPSRDLERVFERFYRVDRARSRETGGTGLGLAIVRNVASNHGGTVAVESVEGQGSVFTLRVPRLRG